VNKYFYICVIALLAITNNYSQCACCAGAGIGSSNGDYINGILTLPKNNWLAETYADYRTINGGNHSVMAKVADEEALLSSMWIQSIGVRYGLTDKITFSALLPYVSLYTDSGNDGGLGDLMLMSTFSILNKKNFNIGLQAGFEFPTGIQKGGTFDNETVIIGSGSYDPMVGIILDKRWDKLLFQANGLYKYTTNGFQGNYYGSIAIQNVSLSYRIFGKNSSCAIMQIEENNIGTKSSNKNIVTESKWSCLVFGGYYGEWLDKLKEDNIIDQNSGYYLGYATLGTNLTFASWSFPLTTSLPVIQNMNGDQNNGGFRIRLGMIKSF
jgi:hypothetical protein